LEEEVWKRRKVGIESLERKKGQKREVWKERKVGRGSLEWKKGQERNIREQRKARIRDRKVRMAGKEYLGGKKGRKRKV